MTKKPLAIALVLFLFAACGTAPERLLGPDDERVSLFRVTKDENANYVVYDLILDADGRIAEVPLDVYWVLDEDGGRRVGLNSIEAGLYGAAVDSVDRDAGRVSFRIRGVESAPMDAVLTAAGDSAAVSTTIDGKKAKLTGVHLRISGGLNPFRPNVEVDLSGVADEGGAQRAVQETIRS